MKCSGVSFQADCQFLSTILKLSANLHCAQMPSCRTFYHYVFVFPPTEGSEVALQLKRVLFNFRCHTGLLGAALHWQTLHHSFSGEILPHFDVKNIFLAHKLTKWQQFKEIYKKNVRKSKWKLPKTFPIPPPGLSLPK